MKRFAVLVTLLSLLAAAVGWADEERKPPPLLNGAQFVGGAMALGGGALLLAAQGQQGYESLGTAVGGVSLVAAGVIVFGVATVVRSLTGHEPAASTTVGLGLVEKTQVLAFATEF